MNEKGRFSETLREIFKFAKDHPGLSYLDLEAYAYENDKDQWIAALRNRQTRRMIALYLRSSREKSGKTYNNPMAVSILKAAEAKDAYERRHGFVYHLSKSTGETDG